MFAFILLGCGTQKELEQVDETAINVDSKPAKDIITAKLGESKRSDAVTINNARIEGNLMYLIVEYSGGCEEHEFELIGSYNVAKSMPPQRGIELQHNANGDNCRALIMDTLIANIEALAAAPTKGSEIFLNLEGYGKQLKYIYE